MKPKLYGSPPRDHQAARDRLAKMIRGQRARRRRARELEAIGARVFTFELPDGRRAVVHRNLLRKVRTDSMGLDRIWY